ncbi:MAG: Jag family protein [Bdellovibrionales bacterium]
MTGIFGKLFGKKKKSDGPDGMVDEILGQIIEMAQFELSYDIKTLEDGSLHVDIFGKDEELLIGKEGALLDALQLYVRRAIQHQLPDTNIIVNMDSANFREQANEALIALAEKLKDIALTKGKSVYFRALPPKDRKVIHQFLAEDGRVKSRSIGEGHFKKIKIYPAKGPEGGAAGGNEEYDSPDETFGNR